MSRISDTSGAGRPWIHGYFQMSTYGFSIGTINGPACSVLQPNVFPDEYVKKNFLEPIEKSGMELRAALATLWCRMYPGNVVA